VQGVKAGAVAPERATLRQIAAVVNAVPVGEGDGDAAGGGQLRRDIAQVRGLRVSVRACVGAT